MDDKTLEIRDKEINVEEIMATIRENIRRRQAGRELPSGADSAIISSSKINNPKTSNESFQRDPYFIHSNWDLHNNSYFISSHRPYIGKMLVKGRQLVHGEVRRYVDPIISHQTEFNASIVRILTQTQQICAEIDQKCLQPRNELTREFSQLEKELSLKISQQEQDSNQKFSQQEKELSQKVSQQEQDLNQKFSQQEKELSQKISQQEQDLNQKFAQQEKELLQKISQQEQDLNQKFSQRDEKLNTDIQVRIDKNFREVFSTVDKDLRSRIGLAHLIEERTQKELAQKSTAPEPNSPGDINYFLFEEQFRGTREDIKKRQLAFLPYFENCSRVLDIGCGRGEFLEILIDNNIGGIGIDLDRDMVSYCKSRQLDVVQADALSYLESLENESLDGIFIDQVVEHLEPAYLVRLLALCHHKLKSGHYLVIETVNPLSFFSFVNFYIDLTHKRPVHPETLQFLVGVAGFRVCEKKFSSPVSNEGILKKIVGAPDMIETERKNIDVHNQNVELLNSVLFGAQDYSIHREEMNYFR